MSAKSHSESYQRQSRHGIFMCFQLIHNILTAITCSQIYLSFAYEMIGEKLPVLVKDSEWDESIVRRGERGRASTKYIQNDA